MRVVVENENGDFHHEIDVLSDSELLRIMKAQLTTGKVKLGYILIADDGRSWKIDSGNGAAKLVELTDRSQDILKDEKQDEPATGSCRACNGLVSKNANACPHCGEPNPATHAKIAVNESDNTRQMFAGAVMVLTLLFMFVTMNMDTTVTNGLGSRVHNIGLQQDQTNRMIFASVIFLAAGGWLVFETTNKGGSSR